MSSCSVFARPAPLARPPTHWRDPASHDSPSLVVCSRTPSVRLTRAEGKEEEELATQAKANLSAAGTGAQFDASKSGKSRVVSIANPMNAISKATGGRRSDTAAPLYFPGAKSAALRNHSGVKFKVYRVDSPEDVSAPITIIFKLDLAAKTLRTSNPAAPSQKMSRKYYSLKSLDIDLWEFDGNFGMSLIERVTKWGCCGTSGVERDYVFVDELERSRFCSLIHAIDDGVLPQGSEEKLADTTPKSGTPPLKLFVSTWNQGDTETSTNLAGDWLPNDDSVDIFVVGTQESPLNNAVGAGSGAQNDWYKKLADAVGDGYVTVATRAMFQNFLWVATKREHADKFSDVETIQAEQGIGKVWGNKGGTAVALKFNGHKMCFVNTHLAAHAEKWEARNDDIQNIVKEVHFGNYTEVEFNCQYTTFWLGDMNYRVEMDRVEATKLADEGNLDALLENEQLKREMGKGLMDGFVEGELTFRPTYKMDPLSPSAATVSAPRPFSDHKDRTPSWTDRVLMKPMPGHDIKLTGYDSAWKVTSSDHDPVYATYEFNAPDMPKTGNYRRFLLEISKLQVTDLQNPGSSLWLTINFPFLDEIKKGVKFKHQIAMVQKPGELGVYENKGRFKLGPFITTSEFFRRRHVLMRVKDKEGSERHGTTAIALGACVGNEKAQPFEERLTHRTYFRGAITGEVLVRVAGGQEEGTALDVDSVVREPTAQLVHVQPPCSSVADTTRACCLNACLIRTTSR
eukprot:COSAG02_NODE_1370_length_13018_cov_50.973218_9_plen_741_part_00